TKASAIIQIGDNLKIGMDRVTMGNGLGLGSIIINANNTSNNVDLFSPTGGGITVPSTAMGNQPGIDIWYYPPGPIGGIGSSSNEQIAVLKVEQGVCTEINSRANGAATPAGGDYGNFAATTFTVTNTWPFIGKTLGCVENTNSGSNGYYFYQVLYVQ